MQKVFYIPESVKIVFVSDLFIEDYTGGAELTFGAIIDRCPEKYFKIHSAGLTSDLVAKYKDRYWVFGNFSQVPKEALIELVVSKVNFAITEFDYKYCSYRSSHLHKLQTGNDCDCHKQKSGQFMRALYSKAKHVFFMSNEQKKIYESLFPAFANDNFTVLSSVFTDDSLKLLQTLAKNNKNEKYAILKGGSWIKAEEQTVSWAIKNNLPYDLVGGLPYGQFLEKISEYKGLIFRPAGFDTCPRIVIEAKIMNLECLLNENVQHRDEPWFVGDIPGCVKYLQERPSFFWNKILNNKTGLF